ncbi:hypothetical protein A6A06_27125 [Streptomyces sp. CB02923]|uniref:class I SAM-dependent methyltransferase n=1 Tax=Streptomyces sp. CB02923 TaxID=1718985 RepID=UPI000938C52A|nr:hypothetical protein A6A06_27125 [Streptomyces sp. CB02923]
MPEPSYLSETRTSYDTVAADYAELVRPAFERDLLGRAMLASFAELVQAAGGSQVADVGYGPGHVTAHLHSLGLAAFGGIVARYSIIHTPPEVLPTVFEEFHRALAPGGQLLLGFHVGDERRRKEKGCATSRGFP